MKYEDIRSLLKNYIMNTYDIRPSLAEKTVEEMFKKGTEFISIEEQKDIVNIDLSKNRVTEYKQPEVLDKIRCEIEQIKTYDELYISRAYVLQVIDKYRVEDIVDEVFGQMRDTTEEEQKSAADFIERLSKPTGINFYDVLDENGKPKYDEFVEICKQMKMESEEV